MPFTEHFAPLATAYDVVLSDVWGIVHNGVAAHHDACAALRTFRECGGTVVLITNAPRPGDAVARQVEGFGVERGVYDGIVSSGDVTRTAIIERPGQSVFHLGPPRDKPIFEGLEVAFAPLEQADYVVCSGLFDDNNETPDSYRDMLGMMRSRGLLMLCANPDLVVERGDRLLYCAGALAEAYAAIGGSVLYAGKPHRPIYAQAVALAQSVRGKPVEPARVLAIGDSLRTDVAGAAAFGIDCVFVTAGIHAEELGTRDNPDPAALEAMLAAAGQRPTAVMRRLVW